MSARRLAWSGTGLSARWRSDRPEQVEVRGGCVSATPGRHLARCSLLPHLLAVNDAGKDTAKRRGGVGAIL
jgi:hypothetical protein